MKNLTLAILLLAIVLTGCKKEKALPTSVIGTWELRDVLGTQVAGAPSTFKVGNGNIIAFTDTEYQRINDGNVTGKGTYKIVDASAEIDGNTFNKAILYDNQGRKWYFKISGSKLLISPGSMASDGFTMTYQGL